jgi:hypothetical protein
MTIAVGAVALALVPGALGLLAAVFLRRARR